MPTSIFLLEGGAFTKVSKDETSLYTITPLSKFVYDKKIALKSALKILYSLSPRTKKVPTTTVWILYMILYYPDSSKASIEATLQIKLHFSFLSPLNARTDLTKNYRSLPLLLNLMHHCLTETLWLKKFLCNESDTGKILIKHVPTLSIVGS